MRFSNIIQALLKKKKIAQKKCYSKKFTFKLRVFFGRKRCAEKTVVFNTQICRSILMNCIDFKGTAWSGRLIHIQAETTHCTQFSWLSAVTTEVFLLFLHHLHCTLLEKNPSKSLYYF